MTWKPDPRTVRTFGPYEKVSERDGDLTAHLVSFPDGRSVRVLPDDRTSGQKRSRVATDALQSLYELWQSSHFSDDGHQVDPVAYLVGCLAMAGIDFELTSTDLTVTIEEWLDVWFASVAEDMRELRAYQLIDELDTDGWQIVRKGEA